MTDGFYDLPKEGFTPVDEAEAKGNIDNKDVVDSKEKEVDIKEKDIEEKEVETKEVETENKEKEVEDKETKEEDGKEEEPKKEETLIINSDGEVKESKEEENKELENQQNETKIDVVSEITEGKFKSSDELYKAYNELNNKISSKSILEQLNENVAETYGEGVTFNDLIEYKSIDFKGMNDFDIIKKHLRFSDPEIEQHEIDAELQEFELLRKSDDEINQMIEDDEITRANYNSLKARMTRKVRVSRNELIEHQESIDLDEIQVVSPMQKEAPKRTDEEIKAEIDSYEKSLSSFNSIKVDVGEKKNPLSIQFEISDKERDDIKDFLSATEDGRNWVQKNWIKDDGAVDMDKLAVDIYKQKNYDRDMAIAFKQGVSKGTKDNVENINNIDFKNSGIVNENNKPSQNIHAQISEKMNGF